MSYTIHNASLRDIEHMINWANNEKWNQANADALSFQNADPKGFFVGRLNQMMISAICGVKYANNHSFMGLYIVDSRYRAQGYGIKLFNHALQYLDGYNIGLDAVVAQCDNYTKYGFKHSHDNMRYSIEKFNQQYHHLYHASNCIDLRNVEFSIISDYDHKVSGLARDPFLANFIAGDDRIGLAYMQNGKLCGYGIIRASEDGYRINPLFADNIDIAMKLFFALCDQVDGAIFIDVPETNGDFMKELQSHGLHVQWKLRRMYRGDPPQVDYNKVFGSFLAEIG